VEQKTEYIRNRVFNTRSLLTLIVLVGAVTSGNLWLHRGSPPLGYSRYTGYGFSLEYSQLMTMRESDLRGQSPPVDSAGMVQWSRQDIELEQFGVIWIRPEELHSNMDMTPVGALDQLFVEIELSGTMIGERGEFKTMIKDDHEMAYQAFTVEEPGVSIHGIIGTWFCEASGRYLMLYAIHVPDIYHPEIISQEVETLWRGYLTALTCH
jgi:hypothetical protein